MKRWGAVVVLLYVLILAVLAGPLQYILFLFPKDQANILSSMVSLYTSNELWVFLLIAFISQAALLTVPVELSAKRPVTKRSIIPVVAAAALATVALAVGMIFAIGEAYSEKAFTPWFEHGWVVLGVLLVVWAIWAAVFFRWSKGVEPGMFVERQCRMMFKGSILELLVAVPCHILVRQRDDCCAGILTGTGIALGIAVMLFSFGPGIFYLFVARIDRLKGNVKQACTRE